MGGQIFVDFRSVQNLIKLSQKQHDPKKKKVIEYY